MNLITRIINKLKREARGRIGPSRFCIVCNTKFRGKFQALDPYFMENIKKSGYPYTLDDAETLNYKEYSCPYCGCTDRERLYALYLSKKMATDAKYDLLDIAPSQQLKKYLKSKPQIRHRSADLFMEDVDDVVDIMDMKTYSDNRFDIFICSHVLEHVMDDRKAMKELRRILKPDGFGICMVPIVLAMNDIDEDITATDEMERWRRFGQYDHVRLYSKQSFLDRLTESGFKTEQLMVDNFSSKEFTLHGISPKSVLYIVKK